MFGGFIARGCTPKDRDERLFGPRRPAEHAGLKTVSREIYREWQIEVAHRQVGLTVRRDQYSAVVKPNDAGREVYLSGFSTSEAALSAARTRIDLLAEPHSLQWHTPHKRLRKRRGS